MLFLITTLFCINVPYFFVINKEIGNINTRQSGINVPTFIVINKGFGNINMERSGTTFGLQTLQNFYLRVKT